MSNFVDTEALGVYQTYPDIFNNNTSDNNTPANKTPANKTSTKNEFFEDSSNPPVVDSTKSTIISSSSNIANPNSSNVIAGITFAILISFIIIGLFYALYQQSNGLDTIYEGSTFEIGGWELELDTIYQNILLILMMLLMIFMIVILAKSLKLVDNTKNKFNCEIKFDTFLAGKSISDLGIDKSIMDSLAVIDTNPICSNTHNNLRDIVFNQERKKYVIFSIFLPSIFLVSLIFIRIFSDNMFDFLINGWSGFFKYFLFIIFAFSLIGLNIAIGNNIISNKLTFQGSVFKIEDKIESIKNTETYLTPQQLTVLENKLKLAGLDRNALVVGQTNDIPFELNKHSESYNGLVVFTFVSSVILFICISLLCLLTNPFGSFSSIFDLSSSLIFKVIFLLLIFVPFIGLVIASIMYPSCLSNNVSDSILLSSTISPSIGAIIAIILSIIMTIKGT